MKTQLLALLALAVTAASPVMAEEPEPSTPPEPVIIQEGTCTVINLGDATLEIGCSQEEIDSIRARGSSGTF